MHAAKLCRARAGMRQVKASWVTLRLLGSMLLWPHPSPGSEAIPGSHGLVWTGGFIAVNAERKI